MTTMTSWLNLSTVLYLTGLLSAAVGILIWRRRDTASANAAFWLIFSLPFLAYDSAQQMLGKQLADQLTGVCVIVLALLALRIKPLTSGSATDAAPPLRSASLGRKIFLPALLIPCITVFLSLFAKSWQVAGVSLLDPKHQTLAALLLACLLALCFSCWLVRDTPWRAVKEGGRLIESIGWALSLPLMLAMLGGVFSVAQTGQAIQSLVSLLINPEHKLLVIIAYCLGMALFTMIMGNAFAAFPVISAGIALPFLIQNHHGNPAAIAAIGMFSGYCGTLMTPMAANFNIVPAALLGLKNQYHVIQVQIPTALAVLSVNIALIYFLAF